MELVITTFLLTPQTSIHILMSLYFCILLNCLSLIEQTQVIEKTRQNTSVGNGYFIWLIMTAIYYQCYYQILVKMIYGFEMPLIASPNFNIFEIINFRTYESLPRWNKQDPDPMFLTNLNRSVSKIAWHSRFRTVYPHSLQYMCLRAITLDDIEQLLKVLKDPRFKINDPIDKKYQLTALQFAAMKNKFPIIELLLMYGANINKCDSEGNSPLMIAVSNQSLQSINTLLKNGCDRNKANIYGVTPKQKAINQQTQYISEFIDKFPQTRRKFPKFRVKLDVQQQIKSPILKYLLNYKIYSNKISKSPFNNVKGEYRVIFNNFKSIQDIIRQNS